MNAVSADKLFIFEFKKMISSKHAANGLNMQLDILPSFSTFAASDCFSRYEVTGIEREYFKELNGTFVLKYDDTLTRRLSLNGQFLRDKNNQIRREAVTKPAGCVAILSQTNIHCRNYTMPDGMADTEENKEYRMELIPDRKFQYVDYYEQSAENSGSSNDVVGADGSKIFVYIIPEGNIKPVNRMCLIASLKPRRKYYDGLKVVLTNGISIYLYILPFDKRFVSRKEGEIVNYRVFDVSPISMKSGSEALKYLLDKRKSLLDLWLLNDIVYVYPRTCISEPLPDGSVNLAYRQLGARELDIANYSLKFEEPETDFDVVEEVGESESERQVRLKKEAKEKEERLMNDLLSD